MEKPKRSGGTKQLKRSWPPRRSGWKSWISCWRPSMSKRRLRPPDYQKLQELLQQEAAYNAEYDALMETWGKPLSRGPIAAEEGT